MYTHYKADADAPLVADHDSATEEHLPFFQPNRLNKSDLCYAATGLIRYQSRFSLIHGQVARFSTPANGWFNQDVEFALYILLAKLATGDIPRFDFAQADHPGFGNSSLSGESAVYTYTADSVMGFAGTQAERLNPVDRSDVLDMVSGGVTDFVRQHDGTLPFTPKFYRQLQPRETQQFPLRRYDVVNEQWLDLVEVPGLFLPFVDRPENFAEQLRAVEKAYAASARFRWGADLYVGTETFTPEPGVLLRDDAQQQAQIEQLHDTGSTMRLSSRGLTPGWCRLPRFVSSERSRYDCLRQILNAHGIMLWRRIASGC